MIGVGGLIFIGGGGRILAESTRTDLSVHRERAVLATVLASGRAGNVRNPLAELHALADAAGAEVVDAVIQRRARPSTATYFGKGKLEELRERCEASDASVVIFDNELTPAQIRKIEARTERKILDRSELILDIFATRARTHEARLQVELAQLQYTAPRLRGMWTHLERIAGAGGGTAVGAVGGIGTRGPGERQIEIDRRIVADRITHLKRQIRQIDKRKSQEVKSRADEFTVSLVGYTNSGKSTLMNALTGAQRATRDALFVTLDTKTVRWELGERQTVLLSDTVGFVRDLPHRLVASFRATLEEAIHANLLLHVVDASKESALQEVEAVRSVLEELGCVDNPTLVLLNKMDVADDVSVAQVLEERWPDSLRISAKTGEGLDLLVTKVTEAVTSDSVQARLRVGVGEGKALAALSQAGQVLERHYEGQYVELVVVMGRTEFDRIRTRFPQVVVLKG